jgi:uncharacterized protein
MMAQTQSDEGKNKEIIHEDFAKWANGTGNFFDLLADDVEWTIIGSSPGSKTYASRKQFLEEIIESLDERLSVKIVPRVGAFMPTTTGNCLMGWNGHSQGRQTV